MKSFTEAELVALPDLPIEEREVTTTCQRCGEVGSITIPMAPRLEVHDSSTLMFWIGTDRFTVCKSDGVYYKRKVRS